MVSSFLDIHEGTPTESGVSADDVWWNVKTVVWACSVLTVALKRTSPLFCATSREPPLVSSTLFYMLPLLLSQLFFFLRSTPRLIHSAQGNTLSI